MNTIPQLFLSFTLYYNHLIRKLLNNIFDPYLILIKMLIREPLLMKINLILLYHMFYLRENAIFPKTSFILLYLFKNNKYIKNLINNNLL